MPLEIKPPLKFNYKPTDLSSVFKCSPRPSKRVCIVMVACKLYIATSFPLIETLK